MAKVTLQQHDDGHYRTIKRERVEGRPSYDSHVTFPATMLAVAYTVATGSFLLSAGFIARYYYGVDLPNGILFPVAFFIAMFIGSLSYAGYQLEFSRDYRDLLTSYEEVTEPIGPPQKPTPVYVSGDKSIVRMPDQPRPGAHAALAQAILDGMSPSHRTGERFGYSRAQFTALQEFWVTQGWARWAGADPRQGVEMLRRGLRELERLVAETASPTPPQEER